ncbi:CRISPR-associated helicase Cas3' [Streptomyces sp. NPDC055105]|uniref:CRISPR-associated helicase Cas3' n=1 Tax=Streptomyces sp. NPDC055105 TaxID=3365719 RepID=UPI0037D52012
MKSPERGLSAYKLVWGKTDLQGISRRRGGPAWNPALAHFLDVAAVAGILWDRYLTPGARARLTEAWGAANTGTAKRVVMALAGLHDLGKGSSCFQRMFANSPFTDRDPELQQARKEWERQARAAGLPLAADLGTAPPARHEHVSAEVLPRLLGCDCRRYCDGQERYGQRARGLHTAGFILGGHHGHIPSPYQVTAAAAATDARLSGGNWEPVHREHLQWVLDLVGLDTDTFAAAMQPERPSAIPLLLGLIVVADWIASDENRFDYRQAAHSPAQWWQRSQIQARKAIDDLRLDAWPAQAVGWPGLFPDTPAPRPFQAAGLEALPGEGPVMTIVESDTGSGKTKLALAIAHAQALTCGSGGAYLAMPTRAASSQAIIVVRDFLKNALPAGVDANLASVHGAASAGRTEHELIDEAAKPNRGATQLNDLASFIAPTLTPDTGAGRAVLDPFFLRRCMGLVSPFGVGTVDQIALGPQRSQHWFLRLFGLALKTVIIDEAHAYELFQQRLLGAAIEWLADAGASVVVLSATLPASIRTSLVASWCHGHRVPVADDGPAGPITVVDGNGLVRRVTPNQALPSLDTTIDLSPDPGTKALAQEAVDLAHQGGIVAVLRSRVDPAVTLYQEVVTRAVAAGWSRDEVVLLHGRLMPRDRLPREEHLAAVLGPGDEKSKPNPRRPKRLIVVATQVIEQSLDIDFDHLITDLAPVDLLIQRRGRVHRHAVNHPQRPTWCWDTRSCSGRAPRMRVLFNENGDGSPIVEKPDWNAQRPGTLDAFVYAPYVLAATWKALHERRDADDLIRIRTPHDSAPLLEAVYGDRQETDGPLHDLLNRTWDAWQQDLHDETQEATQRLLRPYDQDGHPVTITSLASGTDHGNGENGDGIRGIRALSRLGEDSITTVVLYQQPDGAYTHDPEGHEEADLRYRGAQRNQHEKTAWRRQQIAFARNTLSLPQRWFNAKNSIPAPATWPTLPGTATRHMHIAVLTPDGHCISGPTGITYNPVRGLTKNT